MHNFTCTMISSVDLAHYRVAHAKDWVSVDCGTRFFIHFLFFFYPSLIMTFSNRLKGINP